MAPARSPPSGPEAMPGKVQERRYNCGRRVNGGVGESVDGIPSDARPASASCRCHRRGSCARHRDGTRGRGSTSGGRATAVPRAANRSHDKAINHNQHEYHQHNAPADHDDGSDDDPSRCDNDRCGSGHHQGYSTGHNSSTGPLFPGLPDCLHPSVATGPRLSGHLVPEVQGSCTGPPPVRLGR